MSTGEDNWHIMNGMETYCQIRCEELRISALKELV